MDKQKPSPAAQREAFVAAARAAECDEDPAAFDAKMRVLAKVKPSAAPPPKTGKRK